LTQAGPYTRVGFVPGDVTHFVDKNKTATSGDPVEDTHPHPEQDYFYKIRAFNETGDSAYSATASGQTLGLDLAPPTHFQAVVHDLRYVVLTWQAEGAGNPGDQTTGYIIERRSSYVPFYEVIASLPSSTTSYEDHALDSGYQTYRIWAYSATDNSPFVESNMVYIPRTVRRVYLPIVER
jgi:hypothetical protein